MRYLGNVEGEALLLPDVRGNRDAGRVEHGPVPHGRGGPRRGLPPVRRLPAAGDGVVGRRARRAREAGEPAKLPGRCTTTSTASARRRSTSRPTPVSSSSRDKHREAFNHVLFGIRERKGFIQITGEVGAGKTTVCRAILAELGPTLQDRADPQPDADGDAAHADHPGRAGPRAAEARPDGVPRDPQPVPPRTGRGRATTSSSSSTRRRTSTPELLEQVRLLSNLETDQRKLLQIVLIGQPELREKLNRRSCASSASGSPCAITWRRSTGSRRERYIAHRLRVAGADGRPTFSPWAIRTIHRYSGGVPRLINAVCDKALLYGYVNGTYELAGEGGAAGHPRARGRGRMSLIDEALKRAQEASQREGAKGETARPWTPAPLPDAGLAKRRAARARRASGPLARSRGRRRPRLPRTAGVERRGSGSRRRRVARGGSVPAPTAVPTSSETAWRRRRRSATAAGGPSAAPTRPPARRRVAMPEAEDASSGRGRSPAARLGAERRAHVRRSRQSPGRPADRARRDRLVGGGASRPSERPDRRDRTPTSRASPSRRSRRTVSRSSATG